MTRPYLSLGSAQLNKLFLEAGDDLAKLGLIEQELEGRKALAALQLLQRVRKRRARLLAAQAGHGGANASEQILPASVSGGAGHAGRNAGAQGLDPGSVQTADHLESNTLTIPTSRDLDARWGPGEAP